MLYYDRILVLKKYQMLYIFHLSTLKLYFYLNTYLKRLIFMDQLTEALSLGEWFKVQL